VSRRAGVYCRISSDRGGAGLGVERQQSDCEALAERLGWTKVATYVDNDISAYTGAPRPGYRALLDAITAGTVNAVVAWHPDRLHRSPRELETFIDLLESKHVQVQTVQSGELDLSTQTGRAVARTVGAWSRFESEHKSERIRSSKRQARESGKYTGGPVPFGWRKTDGGSVVLDTAAAVHIRRATQAIIAGRSLGSVAATWNRAAAGGRTTWSYTDVRQMVTRARNAGLIEHWNRQTGERTIVGPSEWPRIVTENQWRAARAVFTDPSRRRVWDVKVTHLLSGIALCPCGRTLVSGRIRGVSVYRCRGEGRGHVARPSEPVDMFIRLLIARRLSQPDVADLLPLPTNSDAAGTARENAAALRVRLTEASQSFAAGRITIGELETATAVMRADLEAAEQVMAAAASTSPLRGIVGRADPAVTFWDADLETQRAVIRQLITVRLTRVGRGSPPLAETLTDPHGRPVELTLDVDTVRVEQRRLPSQSA
jgi:DNA invertase Pin-like site-specific DNA recombinase